MADAGPNYSVERKRLLYANLEHEQTIAKGQSRLGEIERQKNLNQVRADLANAELDDEAALIKTNEVSLKKSIAENDKKMELMVAPKETGNG